jgi:hypothetical protein
LVIGFDCFEDEEEFVILRIWFCCTIGGFRRKKPDGRMKCPICRGVSCREVLNRGSRRVRLSFSLEATNRAGFATWPTRLAAAAAAACVKEAYGYQAKRHIPKIYNI